MLEYYAYTRERAVKIALHRSSLESDLELWLMLAWPLSTHVEIRLPCRRCLAESPSLMPVMKIYSDR